MKAVGIRELKAKLSEYVRLARSGEVVLVTDRGEVVAELAPPRTTGRDATDELGMDELVRKGLLRRGAPNEPSAYRQLEGLMSLDEVLKLIDDERGER